MRILLLSYGTRGDAQPQVVLADALRQRGYDVRVAAPENLRGLVEKAGIEYAPLHGNSQEIMESDVGRRWLSSGNVRAFMKALGEICNQINPRIFETALVAAEGVDAIVGGTLVEDMSMTLAELKKVPFALAHTIPFEQTSEYAAPFVTAAALPFGFLNRVTHRLFRRAIFEVNRPTLNPWRASLGLAPLTETIVGRAHEHPHPVLQLWSDTVLPRPRDAASSIVSTGYVRMPASVRARLGEDRPPEGLVEWLAAGPAPVYLGFGSMPVVDPEALTRQAIELAAELDQRIVISAGWTDLDAVRHLGGDRAHFIRGVDHGWLFPQCAAAVHHGGAGTTAASLEAGTPTVICSVFADQPFWGARVQRQGWGAHVPFAKLRKDTLRAALRRALAPEVKARTTELGAKLRAEDGTAATVDALARIFGPATVRRVA
jgi:sterol 3beta-glucosyltransferase